MGQGVVLRENLPAREGQRSIHRRRIEAQTSACLQHVLPPERTESSKTYRDMFAPPPIQLTRAQIEQLKAEAQARLEEKRQSNESGSSNSRKKVESPKSSKSQSPKQPRKNRLFQRSNKIRVSDPIAQKDFKSTQSPQERQQSSESTTKATAEENVVIPAPFGEQPRRAPVPPKRPARPPSELFLPPPRSAVQVQQIAMPEFPGSPPKVPKKSPRRQSGANQQLQPATPESQAVAIGDASLSEAVAQLTIDGATKSEPTNMPARLPRSSTAPPEASEINNFTMFKGSHTMTKRATIADISEETQRLSGVRSVEIDKALGKRRSAAVSPRTAFEDIEDVASKLPRRATEGAITTAQLSTQQPDLQPPTKLPRKGETMDMLIDSGFFPAKKGMFHTKNSLNVNTHVKFPPPLSLVNKELPDTPDSIMPTPTELYQSVPKLPLPKTKRKRGAPKRSPLAQLSSTNAKANSGKTGDDISPSRLSAIPELVSTGDSRPSSGANTPVATQIHLRGGSVITVTPPELTAWQQHIYVQGPIKLPKPVILPRKNSVATLEAFQEAIDQVYQEALVVPRRRSDDAVVDDVCEWFDEFGFSDVAFEGDVIAVEDINVDEMDEIEELDEADSQEVERFSTPPPELFTSPLERIVAKEVVEMSRKDSLPVPHVPPVENEESLRARGIARMSQQARKESISQQTRKESMTLAKPEAILAITPLPEESMLATSTEAPAPDHPRTMLEPFVDLGGMDWDDEIEELDEQPTWIAPAVSYKKRGVNRGRAVRETRNPVVKMRRLMATASAIL